MIERVIVGLLFILSSFFLPFYVYLTISVVCVIRYKNFWEGIFTGFLIDLLYGFPIQNFFGIDYVATIGQSIIFFGKKIVTSKLFRTKIRVK